MDATLARNISPDLPEESKAYYCPWCGKHDTHMYGCIAKGPTFAQRFAQRYADEDWVETGHKYVNWSERSDKLIEVMETDTEDQERKRYPLLKGPKGEAFHVEHPRSKRCILVYPGIRVAIPRADNSQEQSTYRLHSFLARFISPTLSDLKEVEKEERYIHPDEAVLPEDEETA